MRVIKFYHIAIRLIVVLTITTNYHAQETGSSLKESIAIIHKHNGETLRGIVHHNDAEKIIITSGNEQKITIPYSQIASIEFISTKDETKAGF